MTKNDEEMLKAIYEILRRGNNAQVQNSKDGIKVLEVTNTVRQVIK